MSCIAIVPANFFWSAGVPTSLPRLLSASPNSTWLVCRLLGFYSDYRNYWPLIKFVSSIFKLGDLHLFPNTRTHILGSFFSEWLLLYMASYADDDHGAPPQDTDSDDDTMWRHQWHGSMTSSTPLSTTVHALQHGVDKMHVNKARTSLWASRNLCSWHGEELARL